MRCRRSRLAATREFLGYILYAENISHSFRREYILFISQKIREIPVFCHSKTQFSKPGLQQRTANIDDRFIDFQRLAGDAFGTANQDNIGLDTRQVAYTWII